MVFQIMGGLRVFSLADIIKRQLLMKLFILYIYPILLPVSERGAVPKYTYQATKTNNLMDYSHVAQTPIERFSLFIWQWNVLKNKIKI